MSELTAVAMSGGLDSSVTAWLLAGQGEPVIGLSMLLWDRSEENVNGRCCGALDLGDAKRVAQQCGIAHYTLRMDKEFRQHVVDPFVQDYLAGRTPSPCVRCNTWIKFDLFLDQSRQLGAERIATGHYARIERGADGWELHSAADPNKDQSYFLFEMTQEQLSATRFPLGDKSKADVRQMAEDAGLIVAAKPESMEICFVSNGIRDFVEQQVAADPTHFGVSTDAGPSQVVDRAGNVLGESDPYYRFTVGQRRGLGIAASERLYVLGIEPLENRLVVGAGSELEAPGLIGERPHWVGSDPGELIEARVKIRSRHPGIESTIRPIDRGRVAVEFASPQMGVAPGQAAVFYQGSKVLGGCWIHSRLSAPTTTVSSPLSLDRSAS